MSGKKTGEFFLMLTPTSQGRFPGSPGLYGRIQRSFIAVYCITVGQTPNTVGLTPNTVGLTLNNGCKPRGDPGVLREVTFEEASGPFA